VLEKREEVQSAALAQIFSRESPSSLSESICLLYWKVYLGAMFDIRWSDCRAITVEADFFGYCVQQIDQLTSSSRISSSNLVIAEQFTCCCRCRDCILSFCLLLISIDDFLSQLRETPSLSFSLWLVTTSSAEKVFFVDD
jgi:hypothetical protein